MQVAYLCSRYPDVSHTFIQREIAALRELGLEIFTFAIRRARPAELLSRLDREEFGRTYAIRPPRLRDLVGAHGRALAASPGRYLGTLWRALRLAPEGGRGLLWQLFYFGEAAVLMDQCRRRGVRHIHAHFANVGSDVAMLAARLGGPEWSWSFTMHGSTEFYDVQRHRLAEKVRDASFVACISHFTASQLMMWVDEAQWPTLRIVRCGVDTEAFRPRDGDREPGPLRVLTVGRLVPGKGNSILLSAVGEAVRRGVELELTIVGDGPAREATEGLARDLGLAQRVRFTGAVGQDEIRDHYRRADLFCLPSFAEGVPVVLMEAMAMGIPVVATRITGIPELIDDQHSGLLVTPARADELAEAIHSLALDAELRDRLGRAARETVARDYDRRRNARELLGIYETTAAGVAADDAGATPSAWSATASSERR